MRAKEVTELSIHLEVVQRNTEALTRLVDAVRALGGNGRLEASDQLSAISPRRRGGGSELIADS